VRVEFVDSIDEVPAADWNALVGECFPFLRHEFLSAAERTGCVSPETGWQPCHVILRGRDGRLLGAMPLYEKSHSWGEFVFDWAWAQAYNRAGLAYYPKLVSAVPFTPAPSPRMLLAGDAGAETATILIDGAILLATERGLSSLHVLFPLEDELPVLERAGLMLRKDCQFHWHNRGYRSFDDFLATFSSAKRKKARRDRRHVEEQGIRFRWLEGNEVGAERWTEVHALISDTFLRRGSTPYYDRAFFTSIADTLPRNLIVLIAEHHAMPVACAVFYRDDRTLYGRYWGSRAHYNALHFETCYYQGIDYCIAHGLECFEPGTQGEHKISRGFLPVATWSAHWIAQPDFGSAIARYLREESRHVDRYMTAVDGHSPYRKPAVSESLTPEK